ncbi:MAG: GntR family transcriptional regulator [Azospirillaceae bacterium]
MTVAIGDRGNLQSVPLYEQIKRQISEQILMGAWPPGTVLPSEVALGQRFGVAVGTIRRALSDLKAEGMIMRRRKTGTVVTGRMPQHNLRYFFQYFRLHGADGALLRSRARVISLTRRAPDARERRELNLPEDAEVLALRRTRAVDGRVVMHEEFVLDRSRLPDFPEPPNVPELLYLYLLERYGIRLDAVREQLTADAISAEDRSLLDIGEARAILVINQTAFDQGGAPTIVAWHRVVTDGFTYVNEVR